MPNLKAKMLIVDDEPTTRALLCQVFRGLGHEVKSAEDGFTALEEIRTEVPDVLLSDLNMPGMSGFELLSVVRRRIPRIYVIASSGAFSGGEVPNGVAADAFYEKATGLGGLFRLLKTAAPYEQGARVGADASTPIWISPSRHDDTSEARVLITCPQCLRAFPLQVGAADFVIHETSCVYCETAIHYATVQPMNPEVPHRFHAQPDIAPAVGEEEIREPEEVRS
jgi:CheY-like chemotaxis protein